MLAILVDTLPIDGGGSSFTLLLWGALIGLAGFVGYLIRQQSGAAQKQIDAADERAKDALASSAATIKEERNRADDRERAWMAKLDKVVAAQEELDGNVSGIHTLLDGLIRIMLERQEAVRESPPTPPTGRRRTSGGEG